eukprot:scaffold76268_cov75-Phaeocystis_antarctica.AAC.3
MCGGGSRAQQCGGWMARRRQWRRSRRRIRRCAVRGTLGHDLSSPGSRARGQSSPARVYAVRAARAGRGCTCCARRTGRPRRRAARAWVV